MHTLGALRVAITRTIALAATLALAVLALPGCESVRVDYLGRSFAPTDTVELYYAEHELNRPRQVIGSVRLEAPAHTPVPELEARLIAEAQAQGAHAALIDGLEWQVVGESESFTVDRYGHRDRSYSGTARSSVIRNKVLTARLVRFDDTPAPASASEQPANQ